MRAKSFQAALEGRPRQRPAAMVGMASLMADDESAGSAPAIERALKLNPSYVPGALLSRRWRWTTASATTQRSRCEKALEVNPNSLEARSLDAAIAFLEDRKSRFRREGRGDPEDQPALRRGLPRRRRHAVAQLPVHRGAADFAKRAVAIDPDNARAHRPTLGLQLLRTGDEPARARRPGARVQRRPLRRRHLQPADDAGLARQVRDGPRRRRRHALEPGRSRSDARAGRAVREGGAGDALEAWDFKPDGSNPHRDVPEARRLRGSHDGAARA